MKFNWFSIFKSKLRFTKNQIQTEVYRVFPNKYVIDGLGVSGYIPKFSDSDSLTTGTLYYSGSNNLVFTELPTTTTSENLYKLVVEDNIVKKQLEFTLDNYDDLNMSYLKSKTKNSLEWFLKQRRMDKTVLGENTLKYLGM